MRRMWIVAAVVMACAEGWAAWPFGNVGLNVDAPAALLDVGGTNLTRGPVVIWTGYSEVSELLHDRPPPKGFMFWNEVEDDWQGIVSDDDDDGQLLIKGPANFDSFRQSARFLGGGLGGGDSYVGIRQVAFTGCSSTNYVVSTFAVNEFSDYYCFLTSSNGFRGARVNLFSGPESSTSRMVIITDKTENGSLIVSVGNKHWFTISAGVDMLLELMWTPAWPGRTKGRWTLLRAVEAMVPTESLDPVFHNPDDGPVISGDGGEVE